MSDSKTFEIDFSEAKAIPPLPETTQPFTGQKTNPLHKIWGFSAQCLGERASGPGALGTLLHHFQIGWNHLPRLQNGRPVNDPYLKEIAKWSASPDLISGSLGTSPAQMLKSLRKASLIADWYAGNSAEQTMELIAYELAEQRPVIVLINHKLQGHPLLLEWQVVFNQADGLVFTKHSGTEDGTHATPEAQFIEMITMDHPQLSCSVITVRKE